MRALILIAAVVFLCRHDFITFTPLAMKQETSKVRLISELMNLLRTTKMKYAFFLLGLLCVGSLIAAPQQRVPASPPPQGQTATQTPTSPISSSAPGAPQARSNSANEDYLIGPEDVLEINVWHEPELAMKVVVRPDG